MSDAAAGCGARAIAHAARVAAPRPAPGRAGRARAHREHVPALVARPVRPSLSYWAVNRFTFIELALVLVAGSVLVMLYGRARGPRLPPAALGRHAGGRRRASGAACWCWPGSLDPPTRVLPDGTLDYDLRWGFLVALAVAVPARRRGRARRGAATTTARARRVAADVDARGRHADRAESAAVRALVTGATGKVGHAIARALARARRRGPRARARPGQRRGRAARRGRAGARRRHRPGLGRPRPSPGCEVVFNAMGLPEQWLARREPVRPRERRGHARGRAGRARRRRAAARAHEHRGRVPRRARRAVRRVAGRRLPEGHGLRALEAARRAARARRARRPRGRDRQPGRRVRARARARACRSTRACSSRSCGGGCPRCRRAASGSCSSRAWRRATCSRPTRGATASATSCATRTSRCASSPRPSCGWPGAAGCRPRCRCRSRAALAAGSEALSRVIRPPAAGLARPALLLHLERGIRCRPRPRRSWAGSTTPLEEGIRQTLAETLGP